MRATLKIASAFVLVGFAMGAASSAHAACKRFGFTVNDYGKDGPIRDAKALLDKHIASWAGQQGIKDYTVGKKDVSCELFLNFIVFDEHTCTASANVCWGGDRAEGAETAATGSPPPPVRKAAAEKAKQEASKEAAKKPQRPIASEITLDGHDVGQPPQTAETPADGSDGAATAAAAPAPEETEPAAAEATAAAPSADDKGAPDSGEPLKMATPTAPAAPDKSAHAELPATPPAGPGVVETGTLPAETSPAATETAKPEHPVATLEPAPENQSAAAAAAETAAAAAKEAAAAAIAAGASSRTAIVPPLDTPARSVAR